MKSSTAYANWSKEDLITRILDLEASSPPKPSPKQKPLSKPFNFAAHPKRKIALRFCYSGWEYGGLAFQQTETPLPTVENVLFNALVKTRLVDEDAGFEGCGWERCGRTDKGVSGAGQVVSLWARSALGTVEPPKKEILSVEYSGPEGDFDTLDVEHIPHTVVPKSKELQYVSMINRVLPPTIRVLAWSPVSPDFSARFACKYRHYKYFFHSRGLDIGRMQDSADRLVGEHDFRNLCKLDPARQITTFRRRILHAGISPAGDGMYVFDLMGTAFLYNQVRQIVAILFLVGSGLEMPQVMSALLNVDKNNPYPPFREGEEAPPIVDTKPEYTLADALPLVIWDCVYDESDVQWQTGEEEEGGLYRQMRSIHERSMVHTTLDAYFLETTSKHHEAGVERMTSIPLGAGTYQRIGKYIPLLERRRMDSVEQVNSRWLARKM
jgi:tRNA pseudouridine38/39 synthase